MKNLIKNTFDALEPKEQFKLKSLILLDLVISILDIAFLAMLVFIIHFYTQSADVQISFFPAWLTKDKSLLLITIFFPFFCLKNLAGYLVTKAHYRFVYNVSSRISDQNLAKYLEGSYKDYVEIDSAVHIRRVSQEPIEFGHYVLSGVQQIISNIILIILTIIAILLFNAKVFLILIAFLSIPVLITSLVLKKKLRIVRTNVRVASEKSLQHLQEALSGYVESSVYDKADFFTNRYGVFQKSLNRYLSDILVTQAMPSRLIEIFAVLGFFILLLVNKWWGDQQSLSLVTIGAFLAAAYKIIPGAVKILNLSSQVRTYSHTIPPILPRKNEQIQLSTVKPALNITSIKVKNLEFSYRNKKILHNLNFDLSTGEWLGISGLSGRGKTTLVNLILGFLEADSGKILFNHDEADAKKRQQFWKNIAYIKQETFLVHDTILNNIILDENGYDPDQLAEALQYSGLSSFIKSQPEGLQQIVTENGKNISGGQRQRIALARALYKKADLLILDEPFNELDENAETEILQYIKTLAKNGKMVIMITHNTSGLFICDKIISLDEG